MSAVADAAQTAAAVCGLGSLHREAETSRRERCPRRGDHRGPRADVHPCVKRTYCFRREWRAGFRYPGIEPELRRLELVQHRAGLGFLALCSLRRKEQRGKPDAPAVHSVPSMVSKGRNPRGGASNYRCGEIAGGVML